MLVVESTKLGIDTVDYQLHMHHALELAENVLTTSPNPRVGCVIVGAQGDKEIVGEGWHQQPGAAHAEINALVAAGENAHDAIVFVSLEPCAHHGKTPPCADALVAAGVRQVVIASLDPFPEVAGKGIGKIEAAGIEVIHLIDFESRAKKINAGYFKRLTGGLPFVRCKLAMSLDGRTAAANGESKWISCADSRAEVQRLRAASCAIVTGIDTVLQDDPALTVRVNELGLTERERSLNQFVQSRQPMRVVLDSRLRMPETARILQQTGSTRLFTLSRESRNYPAETEVIQAKPASDNESRVDLVNMLELLVSNYAVNEVLLEAGPTLSGAFVQAGLVDELIVYIGSKLLGSDGRPLMELPGLQSMADQVGLTIKNVAQIGSDCRIIASLHSK